MCVSADMKRVQLYIPSLTKRRDPSRPSPPSFPSFPLRPLIPLLPYLRHIFTAEYVLESSEIGGT